MLFSVIASLLLAAGAQPAEEAEPAAETVTEEAAAAVEEAAEAVDEAAERASEAAEEAEEDAPGTRKVCKRKTIQTAFGKMKSVKSCRTEIDD